MNALGIIINSWTQKSAANVASEKIAIAEKAAAELEKAQNALAAAQAIAEKAKADAEEAVHNLPPCKPAVGAETESTTESNDAHIANIVVETLTDMRIVPQASTNQAPAAAAPAPQQQQVTVEKSAEELSLSPAPVAGPTAAKGGNYPAAKQSKQRR